MAKTFYEPGRYWGTITRQRLGETKTGKAQLVLSFQVLGKINPADPQGELLPVPAQYERTVFRVITDKTIGYVTDDLLTLGFTGASFQDFDEGSPNCCDLRNHEHAFSCTHENDQDGEPREKWSIARDSTGPNVKALDEKAIRKLDAMFGKHLKELAKHLKELAKPAVTQAPPKATQVNKPVGAMNPKEVNREVQKTSDIPF